MNEMEIVRYHRIPGVAIFLDTVNYRTPHFHDVWELIWLLDNGMTVKCGEKEIKAVKGDLLLISPDQPHSFSKEGEDCTFLCLQVSRELLSSERYGVFEEVRFNDMIPREKLESIQQTILEAFRAYLQQAPFYDLYCQGQVTLIYHFLFSNLPIRWISREEKLRMEKQTQRLASLIRFVDENYMHKLKLADFAEAEGFSVSYLSHFIKKTMNQSFQDYVKDVRMNCARRLMVSGEKSLTQISLESGFSDYRYFSEAFQDRFGMTPEQYRRSELKPDDVLISHSIHSMERFYSDDQSLILLAELLP